MNRLSIGTVCLVVTAASVACAAQGLRPAPVDAHSTLSGHVVCADTGAPPRFAHVFLKSTTETENAGDDFIKSLQANMRKAEEKEAAKTGKPVPPPKVLTDDQKRRQAAASRNMSHAMDALNSATVGLDGMYQFLNVKAGTYYVHVVYPGYVDPLGQFTDEELASTDPAVRSRLAQLTTVTLTGTDAARVDLRLVRGSAIVGRVVFDDGAPAVGWNVTAMRPDAADDGDAIAAAFTRPVQSIMGAPITQTDDQGRFRIAGLARGAYQLVASVQAPASGIGAGNLTQGGTGIQLTVYSGSVFRRSEAKAVSVGDAEEFAAPDITVHNHALHNIAGKVVAKEDNHPLNAGMVVLTTAEDKNLRMTAGVRDDGSFRFEDLPSGSYTLSIEDGGDAVTKGKPQNVLGLSIPNQKVVQKYLPATQPVVLRESDAGPITLQLVAAPRVEHPADE